MVTPVEWSNISLSQIRQHTQEQGELFIPCFRCGLCCNKYQVNVSLVEAWDISDKLGISWDEFLERYIYQCWPGSSNLLLRQRNGACVFLEHPQDSNRTSCLIHPFKPSACQEWTPSLYRHECREGLEKCFGLKVDP